MSEFFLKLFDTSDFPPRWYCGVWSDSLGWLHIVSDILIFAAYAAIPAVLAYFVMRRKDVPFPPIFWLFAAFILFCGTGHLVEATLFWQPWYRLSGLVKVLTAGVSWAAVIGLARIIPQALTLPDLARVNNDLKLEVQERRRAEDRFRVVIEAAPSAILLVSKAGRIVLVNSHAETLFGYTRDDLLGQQVEMLVPESHREHHPELRKRFFDAPAQRLMGGGSDLTAVRKDGSEFPVEIGLNPIDTSDGPMVLSVIVDISDRKRSEEEMRALNKALEHEVEQRTRQAMLLHDVAAICNQAESVDDAIRNTISRLCQHLSWPLGHVLMRDKESADFESTRLWVAFGEIPETFQEFITISNDVRVPADTGWLRPVLASGKPQWLGIVDEHPDWLQRDGIRASGIHSAFTFPIVVDDEAVAIIEILSPEGTRADADLMTIAHEMGRLLGLVVERFDLQKAVAESIESEQRRIAEELHDGLGQELTAISFIAKSLHRTLEAQGSPVSDRAKELADTIPRIVRHTRAVVRGLMPVEMDSDGLMSALQQMTDATEQRHGIVCRLEAPQPVRITNGAVAHHLFRIAQEATTNAVKHSGAERITVGLRQEQEQLVLQISDDGHGVQSSNSSVGEQGRGMGVRIMKHRANLIGGTLSIDSEPQHGAVVTCRLNLEEVKHDW